MNDEELKIANIKERFINDEEFRNKFIELWVYLIDVEKEKVGLEDAMKQCIWERVIKQFI